MTDVNIIDTGYPNITDTGAQLSLIANSGAALTLLAVDLTYGRSGAIADNPVPTLFDDVKLNMSSFTNPVITISGILQPASAATMQVLDDLVKSRGVKLLYGGARLTENLGAADATHAAQSTHLHVLCKALSIKQTGKNGVIRYTLVCEETA
jgi:hypothetical protein|tara:strand:- start:11351 stop:11806 length:456 start_codon:yes stop_codon:yes gene_type:complete